MGWVSGVYFPTYRFGSGTVANRLFFPQLDADLLELGALIRQRLTANTTINVPSDFSTIQAALDFIAGYIDPGGFTLTVQLAEGCYAGFSCTSFPFNGFVLLNGDTGTPGNVIINTAVAVGLVGAAPTRLAWAGIRFTSTISVSDGSQVVQSGNCQYNGTG